MDELLRIKKNWTSFLAIFVAVIPCTTLLLYVPGLACLIGTYGLLIWRVIIPSALLLGIITVMFVMMVHMVCCASSWKPRRIKKAFLVMSLLIIATCSTAILAGELKAFRVHGWRGEVLVRDLHNYSRIEYVTSKFDQIQKTLRCCGVVHYDDWELHTRNKYRVSTKTSWIPISCRRNDIPPHANGSKILTDVEGVQWIQVNNAKPERLIYTNGCLKELNKLQGKSSDQILTGTIHTLVYEMIIWCILAAIILKMDLPIKSNDVLPV